MGLLEVQKTALKHSAGKPGFAYFMEMGLGKTLTALTEFMDLVSDKTVTRLVVVCPNSFKSGWVDEIEKHNIRALPYVFESGADYDNDQFLKVKYQQPPVLIINYEAIRKATTQDYIYNFVNGRNCMLVLDESIQIKTYDSLQTKAALKIAGLFKRVRVLSGKPVTQGPHDLWAQLQVIGAARMRYYPFKTTFCRMGGWKNKKVVGTQNEEMLTRMMNGYVFKASKEDWTDLPEKMYTSRQYQLTPTLMAQYRSMEEDFVLWLNENENVAVDAFITKYIKLAQIQSGFIIKEDGVVQELVPPNENPRFNLVKEIVEETNGKVVIPYVHKHTLGLLRRSLDQFFPAFIGGNMHQDEISAEKAKFEWNKECRVILVQIRAGKYGHTLLGGSLPQDKCSTMVFAENSYSLDDRSQIEDRIHRHGQTQSCLYIDLWGTKLDRRITQALQAKENIAKAVFQYFNQTNPLP